MKLHVPPAAWSPTFLNSSSSCQPTSNRDQHWSPVQSCSSRTQQLDSKLLIYLLSVGHSLKSCATIMCSALLLRSPDLQARNPAQKSSQPGVGPLWDHPTEQKVQEWTPQPSRGAGVPSASSGGGQVGIQHPLRLLKPRMGYTFLRVCTQGKLGMGKKSPSVGHPFPILSLSWSTFLCLWWAQILGEAVGKPGNSFQWCSSNPT